jgi:hypothetical protein
MQLYKNIKSHPSLKDLVIVLIKNWKKTMAFAELIEDVKKLSYDELEELKHLADKYLIELERERLHQSHVDSVKEYEEGKHKSSSDINELKKILDSV